jgi:hypothetical protein
MSCSIKTIVKPFSSRSLPTRPVSSLVSRGFMPAVGSSSRINFGSEAIARAISSLRRLA